ncbi:MAG: Hsp33 family molecular chaperone HslO [Lachnospiraceae bacterium]|nr:Hsp33 family molecular chaperone HslO [Lachnospiraceae bacterium]
MHDYIAHASGADHQVRIFAATTKDLVEQARQYHHTLPVITAALGRLLTAGALMGSMMEGEDASLTLRINCSGPVKGMTVVAKTDGSVKGYAINPFVDLPLNAKGKLDVSGAIDLGVLSVVRDYGLKDPYVGETQIVSGEIAEDLAYFFANSEQTNSSVALGVLVDRDQSVKQAGGFILQLMPNTEERVIAKLEENIGALPPYTTMLEEGMTPEDIIRRVMEGLDTEFYDPIPAAFVCDCSEEKVEKVLLSISRDDLKEILDDGKPVEVACEFCGSKYEISHERLKSLCEAAGLQYS